MSVEDDNKSARELVRVGLDHLRKSGAWNPAEFGITDTGPSDLTSRHRARDQAVTDFERATPAERLRLYQEDRPAWERMIAAYEEHGMRKLLGSPGNLPR